MKKEIVVAILGNPNCGKTTIFNKLTGIRQHTGNYAGVTVESKIGNSHIGGYSIKFIDLPGIYSIAASSPEEEVVFNELTESKIDIILNVLDSSSLKRNLYLTTQLSELELPMLLAFNMSDEAKKKGLKFNLGKFENYFGAKVVQITGTRNDSSEIISEAILDIIKNKETKKPHQLKFGEDVEEEIEKLSAKIDEVKKDNHIASRFYALKLLEKNACVSGMEIFKPLNDYAKERISHLSKIHSIDSDVFIADRRYGMLSGICKDSITMTNSKRAEVSDKIDSVLLNKVLGLPIFFFIMYCVFFFTFTVADPIMGWIEEFFEWTGSIIAGAWSEDTLPILRDLTLDGVIAGVGGVIVFLPNIVFLFLAMALLEDSGYMSRAAFLMDGVMRKFGLHGKSFVPLILGFGCTVPAIMATRTIESQTDRKTTIMILPLMSCGARLPIYALIIPAFFALKYQALVMWVIYAIGVIVALILAKVLKSTTFKGKDEVYIMELPPYRVPSLLSMFLNMWDRSKEYLKKAGTIILAASIVLFVLNTYPQKTEFSKDYEVLIANVEENQSLSDEQKEENIAILENEQASETLEYTMSARIGKTFNFFFAPIGFDWKLTTASLASLAAKEVFVSQLGILYSVGEADEESTPLRSQLSSNYTKLQAFCIMIFSLLSIPCLATLAIIKRELKSWKYVFYEASLLLSIAWVITFIIYQTGTALAIGV